MLAFIRETLVPYYIYIKFVHVIFVMIWATSTIVGYAYFLVPAFKAWRRNPHDPEVIALRNWTMERFDHGVIYEHIAFPMIIITGPLLYLVGNWNTGFNWLLLKILIVCVVAIPVEIADYHLSHFGGNKRRVRETGNMDDYEKAMQTHWMFFLVTSAPIMIFTIIIIFLAITKPF